MRKVMMICLLLTGVTLFAQPPRGGKQGPRNDMHEKMQDLSPQQRADIKTKKMTLDLDLTAAQQTEMQKIHLEIETDRAERKAKRQGKKELSSDEFYKRTTEKLDSKIAMKKRIQAVLTEAQFEKFEKAQKRRGRERRHHLGRKSR